MRTSDAKCYTSSVMHGTYEFGGHSAWLSEDGLYYSEGQRLTEARLLYDGFVYEASSRAVPIEGQEGLACIAGA